MQLTMLSHEFAQPRISTRPLGAGLPLGSGAARRRSGATSVLSSGRALFWQGERQTQNIEVLQGVVRAVRLLENGNRQILEFYWPGDIVPAQALSRLFTVEAVTPCRFMRLSPTEGAYAETDLGDAHHISEEMLSLLTMCQKNSVSRIAWLLLRIRRYLPRDPKRLDCLQILLPRADMSYHLGTSLETVCRTLTEFKAKRLIDLPTRKTIQFVDINGLYRIANA